jgi:hypothetical protein
MEGGDYPGYKAMTGGSYFGVTLVAMRSLLIKNVSEEKKLYRRRKCGGNQ